MSRFPVFVVLTLLHAATALACAPSCRFALCDGATSFRGGRADEARTGALCLNGAVVGAVRAGEALVRVQTGKFVRISQWAPVGLRQRFAPQFVGAYPLAGKPGSGIGTQRRQANQGRFAVGKCYKIPLVGYQELKKDGSVASNVNLSNPDVDCIALEVRAPQCFPKN